METKFWHQSRAITQLKNNERKLSIPTFCQYQCIYKIHQLVHKILSINEILTSIKGHNSLKMNEKYCSVIYIYILSILMHIQNLIEIHKLIHKILSISQILTSIKGHNYVRNGTKITCIEYNMDLVYISAYTKFYKNLSICSEDIEETHIFTSIKGHNSLCVVY